MQNNTYFSGFAQDPRLLAFSERCHWILEEESQRIAQPAKIVHYLDISKNNTLRTVRHVRLTPGTSEC